MLNIAARVRRRLLHPLLLIASAKTNRAGTNGAGTNGAGANGAGANRAGANGAGADQTEYRRLHWPLADKSEPIPIPPDFTGATPLIDLPLLSLDTETTGLDPKADRIISLAAAPLLRGRLYLHQASDFLINPGRPIPMMSTAIHGITDQDVATASPFADHAGRIQALLQGYVLLGHNVIFDALILQHEIGRHQNDWQPPPLLDTLLLYATVRPQARNFGLDQAARKLRVSLAGRHTALGDALIALDLFRRLLPPLAERGIITLAQAQAASRETLDRLRKRHHQETDIPAGR